MRVYPYVLGLVVITLLAAVSLALTLFFIDPTREARGRLVFFASGLVMLTGFFALIWLGFRRLVLGLRLFPRHLRTALRQGGLTAAVVTALALLQAQRSLTWPRVFGVVMAAVLIEYVWQTRQGLPPVRKIRPLAGIKTRRPAAGG